MYNWNDLDYLIIKNLMYILIFSKKKKAKFLFVIVISIFLYL